MKNNSVRLIIINENKELLLIKRVRLEIREPSKLILPGGRVEYRETNFIALKREIHEELGIKIENNNVIFLGTEEKSSYDDMVINFYFFNQSTRLKFVHTHPDEVESINYYDLSNINPNEVAFGEHDLLLRYYEKCLLL